MGAVMGDLQMVTASLAEGANPSPPNTNCITSLSMAAAGGYLDCLEVLIAAGANFDGGGCMSLHAAAASGQTACIQALLAAGAKPMALSPDNSTPLHWAALSGCIEAAQQLLAAAPQTATLRDRDGRAPVATALVHGHFDTALMLLQEGPLQPPAEILEALAQVPVERQPELQPHYTTIAARLPLTAGQWAMVPLPCPTLATVLPAVLARSADEAALLVRRLLPEQRLRLRTTALALARAQRRSGAFLPSPIERSLIAACIA